MQKKKKRERKVGVSNVMGVVNKHMPKWPPLAWLSVLLIHGSELAIKQRSVVKCSWEVRPARSYNHEN